MIVLKKDEVRVIGWKKGGRESYRLEEGGY
jgi:hypothetical protein